MGLDMYLKASLYLSGWEHSKDSERKCFKKALSAVGMAMEDLASDSPSGDISFTVLYWRKANAIHKWFVDNAQEGKDECQESYVSREQLAELATLCETVLAHRERAAELLPNQSGFFFGGTEYADWYFEDLQHTAARLRKLLANPKFEGWSFAYRASW